MGDYLYICSIMARKTHEDSIYKVSIHSNGGYRYAATHPYTLAEDGSRRYRLVHWGTVTETNRFIPGKRYENASEEERAKLIFPQDWDLSAIRSISLSRSDSRLYGDVWLLENIAAESGLREDLLAVFNGNSRQVDDILTLAFFPCLSSGYFSRISSWQKIENTPSTRLMDIDALESVLSSISAEQVEQLYRRLRSRHSAGTYCAVDSVSKLGFGESLSDIQWGRRKERISVRQTVDLVVYSLESKLPVHYMPFSTAAADSSGLSEMEAYLRSEGFADAAIVTDRAYHSLSNLDEQIKAAHKLIMCTNVRQDTILDLIPEGGQTEGMRYDARSRRFFRQHSLMRGKLKLNVFFNPFRRNDELRGLEEEIAAQGRMLEAIMASGDRMDDDRTLKSSYWWYNIEYDAESRKLLAFSRNQKRIEAARRTSGYYANATSGLKMSSLEAMSAYGFKYDQEKNLSLIKGQVDFDKNQSEGWRLILFLSMFFNAYLTKTWRESALKDKYRSTADFLDELRPMRPGERLSAVQSEICRSFGIDAQEVRLP